jgi:hypothetical protein
MRFITGPIPDDDAFRPEEQGWVALREPSAWMAQLLALPIALGTGAALLVVWAAIAGPVWSEYGPVALGLFLPAFLVMVPVHEAVHLVLHPRLGGSPSSAIGFWPKKLMVYAYYEGELPKHRFLLILAGPLVALTVVPVILGALFSVAHPVLVAFTLANGVGACLDLLGLVLLGTQVPAGAVVRNKGYRSWWRLRP